jgi:hypothetical protein
MLSVAADKPSNPFHRASSLDELLSWHDVDFVRCAYVTVLGRQPDPEGEAYYARRMREGRSKLEVLWQLRRSNEARSHDPGIAGFDRALKLARWQRGSLGWMLRPFTGGEGNSGTWRRHRMLLNEVGRNAHQLQILSSLVAGMAPSPQVQSAAPEPSLPPEPVLAAAEVQEPVDVSALSARELAFYNQLAA